MQKDLKQVFKAADKAGEACDGMVSKSELFDAILARLDEEAAIDAAAANTNDSDAM